MKIISLINMKGGVAKTTMAVNIVDFLVNQENQRVLLVDVDPQFNATQCVLSGEKYIDYIKRGGYTILNIFDDSPRVLNSVVNGSSVQEPIKFSEIEPVKSERGFDFIPGNLQLFKLEIAAGSGKEHRLKNYLKTLESAYDYIIIDSPPTPSVWLSSALIASDYYLIPVKPDPLSTTGVDLLQGVINEKQSNYGFNCKCCGIVLTMVDYNSTTILRNAEQYFSTSEKWKNYLYNKHLLKRTAVAKGQLSNTYIRDIDDSALKSEFSSVVKELLRRVNNEKQF
ncbi:AAA domain protein [anaerobic digester metagenome]